MRHLAAYLLLVIGGKAAPTADDVTAALGEAGIEVDSERLEQLITELDGKSIPELLALGQQKLYRGGVSAGGAAAAAPAAAGAGMHTQNVQV
jgi:large subunit ribosomal protein LP2